MKKKILILVAVALFAVTGVLTVTSAGKAKADTSYCDDNPATPNWGYCYYFPDVHSWLCLKGPAKTCDGVHIE